MQVLVTFKIVVLSIQIKTKSMYHNFEWNKICATVFLKWTDFSLSQFFFGDRHFWENERKYFTHIPSLSPLYHAPEQLSTLLNKLSWPHNCEFPQWATDSWCDDGNNNAECDWDGGACCPPHEISNWNEYCDDCECLGGVRNDFNRLIGN